MIEETREIRLKRLHMRSIRRGIKEMDLILGAFSEFEMGALEADDLDLYEALLHENDHDLYAWVAGSTQAPERFASLIARIARVRPLGV